MAYKYGFVIQVVQLIEAVYGKNTYGVNYNK